MSRKFIGPIPQIIDCQGRLIGFDVNERISHHSHPSQIWIGIDVILDQDFPLSARIELRFSQLCFNDGVAQNDDCAPGSDAKYGFQFCGQSARLLSNQISSILEISVIGRPEPFVPRVPITFTWFSEVIH